MPDPVTTLRAAVEDAKTREVALNRHLHHPDDYERGSLAIQIRWDVADAVLAERDRLRAVLVDMVGQFAYSSTHRGKAVIHTGGLSALESAFDALGWPDPKPVEMEAADRAPDAGGEGTP